MKYTKLSFCIVVFFVSFLRANSQVNLKIGYSLALPNFEQTDALLAEYNQLNSPLEKELNSVGSMHGIIFGVRYKTPGLGFDLSWENTSIDKNSIGLDGNGDIVLEDDFSFSVNNYSFGIENYVGRWGYGVTLDSRRYQIKTSISNTDLNRVVVRESKYSSQFYLLFAVQTSNTISFVVKPYYQFPWGEYNLSAFAAELFPNEPARIVTENPKIFGISLLFYNGRQ